MPLPHRVEPAGMKRMAAHQAAQTHPYSLGHPVTLHGVPHVLRAGWIIPARRRKQRRDDELIQSNNSYDNSPCEDPLHHANSFETARAISGRGVSKALRRGLITIDHWGFSPSRHDLTASRKRRLMRFRTTALPMARGTVKPMCGQSCSRCRRQKAANNGLV